MDVVVYVHGLWLQGAEAVLLQRRVTRALGAEWRAFPYHSVEASLAENVAALRGYLARISAPGLHLIGHSMGGLLILELFETRVAVPPGRVVLLGSPVRGSRSARRLARLPLGRAVLGRTAGDALLAPREPRWQGGRDLGVIAGNLGVGLGRLLGPIPAPNDGTVLVEETDLPGAAAHIQLPVSHSGMVFSETVARQTAAFLRDGRFAQSSKES